MDTADGVKKQPAECENKMFNWIAHQENLAACNCFSRYNRKKRDMRRRNRFVEV